jgi:hypothetical protein
MPHYQYLLFGCAKVRAGLAERNPMNEVELLWDWIGRLAETTGIALDWPADTVVVAPLSDERRDQDDILGVVVAASHPEAREGLHNVALLGKRSPSDPGPTALAELCLPLSMDIQTAILKWEIVRFSARGLDLDLPVGRLFLVEGWFDAECADEQLGRGPQ